MGVGLMIPEQVVHQQYLLNRRHTVKLSSGQTLTVGPERSQPHRLTA